MLKFIVGIAIVAFSSFCGYKLAGKHRRRKQFFIQFSGFNERFLGELAYARRPISHLLSNKTYAGEFQLLLYEFSLYLQKNEKDFILALSDNAFSFLLEDEKMEICEYFLTIGKGDTTAQKAYFLSVKERITKRRLEAEENYKRYSDLYVKLGFLCGLFILILII